jgi:hypothetical protein
MQDIRFDGFQQSLNNPGIEIIPGWSRYREVMNVRSFIQDVSTLLRAEQVDFMPLVNQSVNPAHSMN